MKPGLTCSQTVCSVDILATLADVFGAKLPAAAGEDSVSLLPLLRGVDKPIHEAVIHHSAAGVFAVRSGKWKLILGPGSGAADGTKSHLYDLAADIGEKTDLAARHPEEVTRLTELMDTFVADGRSTPGEKQKNDVTVQIVKKAKTDPPPKKVVPPTPKKDAPATPKDVVYKEASGEKLQLHVYAPADAKSGDNRTAIVFFFGGGWSGWNPTQFEPFARHFAGLGCVAVCADYRVSSRHKTTPADAVRDAKSAVRFVREHAKEWGVGPEPDRGGGRVGGRAPGRVHRNRARLPRRDGRQGRRRRAERAGAVQPRTRHLGGGLRRGEAGRRTQADLATAPRPRETATRVVLHGTADTTVPFQQVKAFAKAMKDAGNVCEVEAFDGRGHGFFNHPDFRKGAKPDNYEACVKRATKFLEDHTFLPARVPQK